MNQSCLCRRGTALALVLFALLTFTVSTWAQTLFRGLSHEPAGVASLEVIGNQLQVSDLGSLGEDGFRVDLGDSLHWQMTLPLPSDQPWSLRAQATSTVAGQTGVPTAGLDLGHDPNASSGPVTRLRPDFGNIPATGAILFEVYGPGGEVHPFPLPLAQLPEARWVVDSFFDIAYDIHFDGTSPRRDCEPSRPACRTRVMFPPDLGSLPVHVGGRVFEGIGVGMAYIASPFEAGTTSQNAIEVRFGLAGSVVILDEQMRNGANLGGVPIVSQGGALIHTNGGHLLVDNIGSSGQDGVVIEFGETKGGFDLRFGSEGVPFQVDSFFDVFTEVCFPGTEGAQPLGNVNLQGTANGLQLWGDFSPVEVDEVLVEVLLGGQPAGQFTLPTTGPLGALQGLTGGALRLGGCGKRGGLGPGQLPCFVLPFLDNFLFSPSTGLPVVGNELRVLVPELPQAPSCIKRAVLRGRDLAPIEMVSLDLVAPSPIAVSVQSIEPLPNPLAGPRAPFVRPRFKLLGQGFPSDPRDLCVLLPAAEDLFLPMPVIGIPGPDCAIVELPPLPPDAALGSPIVMLGEGQRLPWVSSFDDLYERWADSFFGEGPGNPESPPLPDPDADGMVPPPGSSWHFGKVDENGALRVRLSGDWAANITLDIAGHLSFLLPGDVVPKQIDFRVPGTFLKGGTSLEECALRIGDILLCVLTQQLNLRGSFQTVAVGDELDVIFSLTDPLGSLPIPLTSGGLSICVTNQKGAPQISEILLTTPGKIMEGTLIKIFGSGFGTSQSGLVVYIDTIPARIPMEAVLVTDTCVIAKVGPIPPNVSPSGGPIRVLCGQGQLQPWVSAFPDLMPETPAEMVLLPPLLPVGFDPFLLPDPPQLVPPVPLPENVEYLQAEVVNGRFCLPLRSDWGPGVSISLLGIFDLPNQTEDPAVSPVISGFVRADRTRLLGSGSRWECAERIADTIRCAFDGLWEVTIDYDPETEDPILYFGMPGFPFLEPSALQMCVFHPFDPINITELHPLTPGGLSPGSLVEICGGPFPLDPLGLCASFGGIPVKVTARIGEKLIGRIGLVPPGLPPLEPLTMEPGRGFQGPIFPHPDFLLPPVPVRIFIGDGTGLPVDPIALTPPEIASSLPDPNVTYFTSVPGDGELCLYLEGDWCEGASLSFEGHLFKSGALGMPPLTFDFFIQDLPVPGGPVEDCARLLKDLPACAFDQLGRVRQSLIWECEPLGDTNENGLNEVKLTVRSSDFDPVAGTGWVGGQLTLCLRCPPPLLEIKNVASLDGSTPVCVREGELLCIEACNAGTEPKDLCAMIGNEPGNVTPLIVQSIFPGADGVDKILAQVGMVPPGAFPAPVYLTRGLGNCGIWQPGVDGLDRPTRPGWVFDSLGNPTVVSRTVVWPKPNQSPPANERCFEGHHNEEASAICLDLTGAWAPGSIIKVSGHIHVSKNDVDRGRDIHSPITRTLTGGTAEDCAAVLKDIFRCQFTQLSEVTDLIFDCPDDGDNDPNTATFKIIPTEPGTLITGHLQVCVCAPPTLPTVTGIDFPNPSGVCTGDIVCISGTGFSENVDDYCILVGTVPDAFRLRPLEATTTKLTCVVEVIPPQLAGSPPLPLCISIAQGARVPFVSAVPGVIADANPWVWSNPGNFPMICVPDALVPLPKPPPPGEPCYFAEITATGEMCLSIPAGVVWGFQQNVTFDGHIFLPPPYGDLDIHSRRVRLRDGGTPEDCARALTDILRCVFRQLDGFDLVDISWNVALTGEIKITLRWPDATLPDGSPGRLDGFLTLCLVDPAPIPSISESPTELAHNVPATIRGTGFGDDPDDLCMVATLPNGQRIPLRVIQATDTEVTVLPGIIPADAVGPGCIEVMRGRGHLAMPGDIRFAFPEIQPIDPIWIWEGTNPDAKAKGPAVVTPIPTPDDPNLAWFRAELVNGKLCVYLRGDWQENSLVTITARAHNACQRLDLDGPSTRFLGSGSVTACAERLKDFLTCAFAQQTGAVVKVSCDPITGANAVKLTIELENGKPIDWGLCNICVSPRPSTNGDADNDGLTDAQEASLHTDPNDADSDDDGLLDGQEVNGTLTNPNLADTDGDGCPDNAEIEAGTNPLDPLDCFEVELVSLDLTTGLIDLCIPRTVAGRAYSICFSRDLGGFANVPGAIDLLPVSNGGQIDLSIPGADEPRLFFYVLVRRP